jgi:hypothetical protein
MEVEAVTRSSIPTRDERSLAEEAAKFSSDRWLSAFQIDAVMKDLDHKMRPIIPHINGNLPIPIEKTRPIVSHIN